MRRYALAKRMLDVPNARSSHAVSTPRGGGVAIAISFAVVFSIVVPGQSRDLILVLVPAVLFVAAIGFLDDIRDVRASLRIVVHIGALAWAVFWLEDGALAPTLFGYSLTDWPLQLMVVFVLVWLLNLFNFMDGIDGIAASEAVFVACSGAIVAAVSGQTAIALAFALMGAAVLGFLPWNWPPAKIFMGDVGSGFLGAVVGILSYAATLADSSTLWVWPILLAVFMTDATITLGRRFLRGERWYEPHRTHAYQRAALRWGHLKVTLVVMAINVCWLLPMATLAYLYAKHGFFIAVLAYAPLVLLALLAGAGRREVAAT